MKKFTQKIILIFFHSLILVFILIYVGSYIYYTRIDNNDSYFYAINGEKIWSFGVLAQSMHLYSDPDSGVYQKEVQLTRKYLPLVKLDQYLFNNYNILSEDRPPLNGE